MIKKILPISLLLSTSVFAYEACGINEEEALNALSKTIYVNVNNKLDKNEQIDEGLFSSFSKNVKNSSSQTSNVILKDVKYTNKNNQVCASVSDKSVQESAKNALNELLVFNINDLPSNSVEEKQKKVNNLLNKIGFVKAILNLDKSQVLKLTELEKKLKDVAISGSATFSVNDPSAKIKIAGMDKEISPSQTVILKEGKYSYTVTDEGKCPVTGSFEVTRGKNTNVSVELGNYPVVTFKTNLNDVDIKVNGESVDNGETKTFKKCSGIATWNMQYDDDTKNGEIELKPNLTKIVNKDFISKKTLKKLTDTTNYYTSSSEINLNFGFENNIQDTTNLPADANDTKSYKRIELNYFKNSGIYKYGYVLAVGTQDSFIAKDIREVELLLDFRIQLPELMDTQFHIASLPLIPYFGVGAGIDVYSVIKDANDNGTTKAKWDFGHTPKFMRGVLGFNILLHKQFGFNFQYAKDFIDKKDNVFSIGLVMAFGGDKK